MINYGDILVLFVIACLVGLVIGKLWRDKKRGSHCGGCKGCSLEGGCSACAMAGKCSACKK